MLAWLPLLGPILQIVGWLLKLYGASEEAIDRYKSLIESCANQGLISVNVKDRALRQRGEILERQKKKSEENPPQA